ncbi:DUF4190 domain-containing protein [Leucobacter denitrificans]|uniref:DUF4190 domain-containing protein n=1 Tax=Leucobacter denitrificans TaxID=683042 RepID=A0A7G9S475_9MICO|nr:DUF4190 domain-containing protein [Leucobacter denitrificans]QNN62650.1 DUF4190 domain-containing protein [Leucobacter denitrificans]
MSTHTLESPAQFAADGSAQGAQPTQPVQPVQPAQPAQSSASDQGNAFAVTSFVLGIASIVAGWTFVAPIVGLIFGIISLRRRTAERTLALWGVWLNAAMLALSVLIGIVVVGIFMLSVLGGAFSGAWV